MNERKYDNRAITEYLLGSLSEAETERFDELSFTDEDFAASLSATEKDLVDAYIHGELKGNTLEKFKSHYLASPLRREKVGFARNFQVYAGQNYAETIENAASHESKTGGTFAEFLSAINIFKNRNLMQGSFAAIALAFVLAGGWWIISKSLNQREQEIARQETPAPFNQNAQAIEDEISGNSNTETNVAPANKENELIQTNANKAKTQKPPIAEPMRTPKKETQPVEAAPKIRIASFVLAPSLRSASRITSLSISKEITNVAMQLQLESNDYAAYRVELLSESNANLWQSGTVKPKGANKTLNVSFPAKLLKSQIYSLQVSGIAADGELEIISNYVFRIVR
jgi:hypothetical protein